jgi:hypothetical protein
MRTIVISVRSTLGYENVSDNDSPLTDALLLAKRDQVQAALKDVADLLGGFRSSLKQALFSDTGAEALVVEFAIAVWGRGTHDS